MESPQPQEPVSIPSAAAPLRSRRASAPVWLWGLVLCGFSSMFWFFFPDGGRPVLYSPWFLDQVDAGTIEAISIQGLEIRGVLRAASNHGPGASGRRFVTYFPTEHSIEPVVRRLREAQPAGEPVQIETHPPQEGGMIRLVLLLQSLALLAIAFVLATLKTRKS